MYMRPTSGGSAHSVTEQATSNDGPGGLKTVGIVAVAAYAAYRVIL